MSEQLALIDTPTVVRLTERQQHIVDALTAAGHDGLTADEIGALLHERSDQHGIATRCQFCARDGHAILKHELAPKGFVTYRRARGRVPGAWITTTAAQPQPDAGFGEIPY